MLVSEHASFHGDVAWTGLKPCLLQNVGPRPAFLLIFRAARSCQVCLFTRFTPLLMTARHKARSASLCLQFLQAWVTLLRTAAEQEGRKLTGIWNLLFTYNIFFFLVELRFELCFRKTKLFFSFLKTNFCFIIDQDSVFLSSFSVFSPAL